MRVEKERLILLIAPYASRHRNHVALTLASLAGGGEGVDFDLYYAADRGEGGLFAKHGSGVIGGQHSLRIARALSSFKTTVVRLDACRVFDSLLQNGAETIIEAAGNLVSLYETVTAQLDLPLPKSLLAVDESVPLSALHPIVQQLDAWVVPVEANSDEVSRLSQLGIQDMNVFAARDAKLSRWEEAGFRIHRMTAADAADPLLSIAEEWRDWANGIDLFEPITGEYMLPFSVREKRLILSYESREEAEQRRDQMLELAQGMSWNVSYGRWFGDPQLLPLAAKPMAYSVVEPCRHILTCSSRRSLERPQQRKGWMEHEPSDEQLRKWKDECRVLATWVLHSGELSHDDAVLQFQDWSAMTKQRIGAGVHWQRYAFDPDAVEMMHVPIDQGGLLGLIEPVLHSAGSGVLWESAGDADRVVDLMCESREKIVELVGRDFAPRGVYCFGDHYGQDDGSSPGEAQYALWRAIQSAGFAYVISSVCDGRSRVLYQEGNFVVLSQAGVLCEGSPFYRGFPSTFAEEEARISQAGTAGWMLGAVDSPIHGAPIYTGRPRRTGWGDTRHRINEFFDYLQNGGTTRRVVSALPHTIARYVRILEKDQ